MEHTQPIAAATDRQFEPPVSNEDTHGIKLKTREEAARWFSDRGITISEWALQRNFNPALVYQVLAGTRKAVRGASFRIAVELGMKSMPADDVGATQAVVQSKEVAPAVTN